MSITRIQNNQITDSTIVAYAKLQSGSLTGNLFAPTLTINSNVTINGNLFLSNTGNTTTINATNTYVNDPLVVFNNGYVGSLTNYDIGVLVNRNLTSLSNYGSVNTAWVWSEADGAFEAIATTDTGTGSTSLNNSGWLNIKVGNATVVTGITASTIQAAIGTVTQYSGQFTTLSASGVTTLTNNTNNNSLAYSNGALQVTGGGGFGGNVFVGGNLTVSGNVYSSSGNINVITVQGNQGQFYGNAAGFGALFAGIATGYVYQPQTVLQNSTNFNGYAQVNHQNINGGSLASSDYVATANNGNANDTYIDMGIASSTYNYPSFGILKPNDGYILVQGNTTTGGGNLILTSGLNDIVFAPGGSNANNEYGRINAANVFVIKSTVASTSSTTGAMTIAGGLGVAGALYTGSAAVIGGNIADNGGGLTTTATTAYLFNDTATTLNIGSAATTLNMGASSGTATVANPTVTLTNATALNINGASPSITTSSTGTASVFNTNALTGQLFGAATSVSVGASTGTLTLNNPTIATSVTSGTLALFNTGLTGTLNLAGAAATVNAFGGATALAIGASSGTATIANPTVTLTNATALNINGASPSIVTSSSGTASVFNTNATTLNVGGAATTISIGASTGNTTINSGNTIVSGNLYVLGTTTTTYVNKEVITGSEVVAGLLAANSTAASTSTTTGALIVAGGAGIAGAVYAGSFQGAIGTAAPNSSNFTTIDATTIRAATIGNTGATLTGTVGTAAQPNITSVGNLTALNVGGITTSFGNIVAAAVTPSTTTTTGAIVVPNGGIGATGNLNVGTSGTSIHQVLGNVVIGTGNGASGAQTALEINQNNATPFNSTSVLHVFANQGITGKVTLDSVGTGITSAFIARAAAGTAASPTAVPSGQTLGSFIARGYGATGFLLGNTTRTAGVSIVSEQAFTDTNQGAGLRFTVVPNNNNLGNVAMSIDNLGNVTVANTFSVMGQTNINGPMVTGGSGVTVGGIMTLSNAAATTAPGTGALVVTNGGFAVQSGNINVGGQLFVGAGSQQTVLVSPLIVGRGTSNSGPGVQYTQQALINATNIGSTDYIAYGNNYPGPSFDHGWMDMGFTGDAFNDPNFSITKANDGYLFASAANATVGGNLVLATDYTGNFNDIVFATNSFYSNAEVARFHGNASTSGTFVLKLPTNSTGAATANTGAFQVWGGASFSGNVYHGGGAIFNGSQTSNYDFKVAGANSTNLLWVRPNSTYDTVVIGNTYPVASIVNGAKLQINSTDSILLPVGTSVQRPTASGLGTDTTGMLRYNTTLNNIEYYTGSSWTVPSSAFTVISDTQFTGTGATNTFSPLPSSGTTAGCIVSINGVLQIPTLAYTVSGTTLTFTENPANGDVIDVRILTTSTTVTSLSDTSSLNSVVLQTANVAQNGIVFYTGNFGGTTTTQYGIDTAGGFVTLSPNVTVVSAGTSVVDNLYANTYSSAKYTITATLQGTNIREISELLLVHNGGSVSAGTATVMSYGRVNTAGNTLVTWGATTSGNIAQLQATTTNANTILRIKRDYMAI